MSKEAIERALTVSLYLLMLLSILDLILYTYIDTAVLSVMAHAMSFWLLIRYGLYFDLVKILETSALFTDIYLIFSYGYALASPFACLISIIIISSKKEKHMNKLKIDLEKIMASKNKDL